MPPAADLHALTLSDGASIRYRIAGTGSPVVLLHGWSQSGAMFRHQIAALAAQHTVVVPDLRGQGLSPAPAGGLRMARLARDVAELMRHLGLARASLLGWSMGASVCWAFIDLFGTARIDRLVLVDQPAMLTRLPGMTDDEAADSGCLFTMTELEHLYRALLSSDAETVRAGFVRRMVTPRIPAALLDWVLAENARTSPHVAAGLLLSHATNDWRDVLPRIDRPTLVIGGTASHVPERSQHFVRSRIPGAALHVFGADEGGAHFMFLEAPDVFNAVVAPFLAGAA